MKKLLLSSLLSVFALFAMAQYDIEVTLITPVANDNLNAGIPFDYKVDIKNTGTTPITTSDTIVNIPLVNGSPINAGGGILGWYEMHNIAVGATYTAKHTISLTGGSSGPIEWCSFVFMFEDESDTTNNESCNTFNWNATVGMGELKLMQVEDNSYFSNAHFNLDVTGVENDNNASVSIYDLSGTLVVNASVEIVNNTINGKVAVRELPSGIYLVQLKSSKGEISTRKVMKQ